MADEFRVVRLNDVDAGKETVEGRRRIRGAETAFRRGFHHGATLCDELRNQGYSQDQLNAWFDRVQDWREGFVRGDETEWIAPQA